MTKAGPPDRPALPLPGQLTSFIGREKERIEVRGHFARSRLVSLMGSGGSGKTRLALQVALDMGDTYPDGVWLVELASVSDDARIPAILASTLAVQETPGRSLVQGVTAHLRAKRLLLVLDNCEHLIGACAALAETLLRDCPQLCILATSREPLGIVGEVCYIVPALTLPTAGCASPEELLHQSEAVRLFLDRATLSRPSFCLTAENAPAVVEICQRLEGMPLALELAAARVKTLSVEQIARRLDDCFRLLTTDKRNVRRQHQTLQATMDWSYDLLSPTEQTLWRHLSVFAGGFSLAAAEEVCAPLAAEGSSVLDLLSQLADKSIVLCEEQDGEVRYRLLETTRQYGAAKLALTGEEAWLRRRHRDFFLRWVEQREPAMGPQQSIRLKPVEREHENIRLALEWCRTEESAEAGLRLCLALGRLWNAHAYRNEGRGWCALFLQMSEDSASPLLRARVALRCGFLAWRQGDFPAARALYERCLELYDRAGDGVGVADAHNGLANVDLALGECTRARETLERALAIYREAGNRARMANALNNLGWCAEYQADFPAALHDYTESLSLARLDGDAASIALSLSNVGQMLHQVGKPTEARGVLAEALALARHTGYKMGITRALVYLGAVLEQEGDRTSAQIMYEESLAIARELGASVFEGVALVQLARLRRANGDRADAASLYRDALALFRATGYKLGAASVLHGLAQMACDSRRPELAARLHAMGAVIHPFTAATMRPHERACYAQALTSVENVLGPERSAAIRSEAQAVSISQAIDFALAMPVTALPSRVTALPEPEEPVGADVGVDLLTTRQAEIVRLIACGLTYAAVSERLHITRDTVDKHLQNIVMKLGLASRKHLVPWAYQSGLVQKPPVAFVAEQ